jgi:uncharacterized protein YlxP (DUF503 family)
MKIRNRTFAISAAVPAIPPKPKRAAIKAIIKKVTAQFNINPPKIDILGHIKRKILGQY